MNWEKCPLENTLGKLPWLVWLSGLSSGLQTKGPLVGFPIRAQAWVAGQVGPPSRGRSRGNKLFLYLFSLPFPLSQNK